MDYQTKIVSSFNKFDGTNMNVLDLFYAPEVHFTDPVKDIKGLANLKSYYLHVYKNVTKIEFDFHHFIVNHHEVFAEWNMKLQARGLNSGKTFTVRGCSVFKFDQHGLVIAHSDYLDLGQMVYEKLPLIGRLILSIKSRL